MQTTQTQNRRAELFEALAAFERDAQLTPETQALMRALRAALLRDEANDGYRVNRKRVAYSDLSGRSSHPCAEGLSANDPRQRVVLRSLYVRAA